MVAFIVYFHVVFTVAVQHKLISVKALLKAWNDMSLEHISLKLKSAVLPSLCTYKCYGPGME